MEMIKFILFLQVAIILAYDNSETFDENIFHGGIFNFSENNAKIILESTDIKLLTVANAEMNAIWNQQSDLKNPIHANNSARIFARTSAFKKSLLSFIKKVSWHKLKNPYYRRQFLKMGDIGIAVLPSEKLREFEVVMNKMVTTFTTAKVCHMENSKKPCELSLEPDLVKLMSTNRNETILKHYWTAWRNATGAKIRPFYEHYVTLGNEAAQLNGFTDKAHLWLDKYEMNDFHQHIESVWREIKPLYLQLHAYVRKRLREKYGGTIVERDQAIPAHLLETMWADSWENIASFTLPFPGQHLPDVTPNMIEQNYTARKIFKLAEASFISMGMNPMPESFWNKSIFEKPTDREIICEPSAWDFYNGNDFRIRMCTTINANSLQRAHHEMGHIQYYMEYKNQPAVFRRGANPGFHEAIGDMISLSITTPKHLERIGLLKNYEHNDGASINHLYLKALELISNLPFAYIMDLYRWKIFQGEITSRNYNSEWWRLVKEFQGIKAPVERTENDFDAASKFHIANDVEYIRYFISNIIQFQFHRALCIVAGDFTPNDPKSKPLHQCDITDSPEAGNLLKSMLKMGSSKPWPNAMKVLTGTRFMNSSGLLDYFQPLRRWLEEENRKTNEYIGWK